MATYKVGFNIGTKEIKVFGSTTVLPGGFVDWGNFTYADENLLDNIFPQLSENLYHKIRARAYKNGWQNMQTCKITLDSTAVGTPPVVIPTDNNMIIIADSIVDNPGQYSAFNLMTLPNGQTASRFQHRPYAQAGATLNAINFSPSQLNFTALVSDPTQYDVQGTENGMPAPPSRIWDNKFGPLYVQGKRNIAYVQRGVNDIFIDGSRTADQIYADTTQIVADLKRAGFYVIVSTPLPVSTAFGGSNTAKQTLRNDYITRVVNNAAGADYVLKLHDTAINPVMALQATTDNTEYYSDKLHPTWLPHLGNQELIPAYQSPLATIMALPMRLPTQQALALDRTLFADVLANSSAKIQNAIFGSTITSSDPALTVNSDHTVTWSGVPSGTTTANGYLTLTETFGGQVLITNVPVYANTAKNYLSFPKRYLKRTNSPSGQHDIGTGIVETGNISTGFTETGPTKDSVDNYALSNWCNKTIAANKSGWVQYKVGSQFASSLGYGLIFGLINPLTSTMTDVSGIPTGIGNNGAIDWALGVSWFNADGSNNAFLHTCEGQYPYVNDLGATQINDVIRIQRDIAGGVATLSVWKNGTKIYTRTGTGSGPLGELTLVVQFFNPVVAIGIEGSMSVA